MGAYSELYLDDCIELMSDLFYNVSEEDKWNFEKFVEGFMNCKYRKLWDEGAARVMNMSPDELLEYLQCDCSEIFVLGKCEIDPLLAGWIGEMYCRLQYESSMYSSELYKIIPLENMLIAFRPLHTVDESIGVDKLLEGYHIEKKSVKLGY